jgi:hypothetical protein
VKSFYIHFTLLELYSRGDLAPCRQRDLLEIVCLRPRGGKQIVQPRSERFDQTVVLPLRTSLTCALTGYRAQPTVYWTEFLLIINRPQGVYCYCSIGFIFYLLVSLAVPKATIVVFRWRRGTRFGRGIKKKVRFHVHSLHDHVCLIAREKFLLIFADFETCWPRPPHLAG